MKKLSIFICILLLALVASGLANAEIRKGSDTFTGGTYVFSDYSAPDGRSYVGFERVGTAKTHMYKLVVSYKAVPGFLLSNTFVDIKINDNPVQHIPITAYSKYPWKLSALGTVEQVGSDAKIDVSAAFVEEVKSAKRIAIKAYYETGVPMVHVLPDSIVTEWRKIATNEI